MSATPARGEVLRTPLALDAPFSAATTTARVAAHVDDAPQTATPPEHAIAQTATPPEHAIAQSASRTRPAIAHVPFVGKPATTTAHVGKTPAFGASASPVNTGSIGSALFALVLVVGLILALGWIARRMPGFRPGGRHSALRVVDSLTLGPRERVVVVAVGDTQLLLGVGAGGTRTLHTLTRPLPVDDKPGATPAFAQLLAQHFGKKA